MVKEVEAAAKANRTNSRRNNYQLLVKTIKTLVLQAMMKALFIQKKPGQKDSLRQSLQHSDSGANSYLNYNYSLFSFIHLMSTY